MDLAFVDLPGHERFVVSMLVGVAFETAAEPAFQGGMDVQQRVAQPGLVSRVD
jgi:translation initiation factor 2 gamma subunit (eIF-2gamma)